MSKLTKRITAMLLAGMLVIVVATSSVLATSIDVDPSQTSEIAQEVFTETNTEDLSEVPAAVGETSEESYTGDILTEEVEEAAQYYTVTLDANGGYFENEWDDSIGDYKRQAEVVEKQIPVDGTVTSFPVFANPDGQIMAFVGWSLERDGELATVGDEEYAPVENCVLYAVWQAVDASSGRTGSQEGTDENTDQTDAAQESWGVEPTEQSEDTGSAEEDHVEEDAASIANTDSETEREQDITCNQELVLTNQNLEDSGEDSSEITVAEEETQPEQNESLKEKTVREDAVKAIVESGTYDINEKSSLAEASGDINELQKFACECYCNYLINRRDVIINTPSGTFNTPTGFFLQDITEDNIPELIVRYGTVNDGKIEILSYNHGLKDVIKLSSISNGTFCNDDTRYTITYFENPRWKVTEKYEIYSYDGEEIGYYDISNGWYEYCDKHNNVLQDIGKERYESELNLLLSDSYYIDASYAIYDNTEEIRNEILGQAGPGISEIIASGSCGNDLTWKLENNGTLTVSGTGDMYEMDDGSDGAPYDDIPWYQYIETTKMITEIIISEGVTSICPYAFYSQYGDYNNVHSIEFPNSLINIGEGAFYGWGGIDEIWLPDNLKIIGSKAFAWSSVKIIHIEDHVQKIGTEAFYKGNLATIYGYENTYAEIYAKNTNVAFVSLGYDDSPTIVGNGKCGENITWKLDTSGKLEISGTGDMYEMDDGSDGTPYDDIPWYQYIETTKMITEVIISEGVTSICPYAFYSHYGDYNNVHSITIPNSIKVIGGSVFYVWGGLSTVYFNGNAPLFDSNAFYGVTSNAYYPANDPTWTEDVRQNYRGNITWVTWNSNLFIDKTYQGSVGEGVAISATLISSSSPKNAIWSSIDDGITFSGSSTLGPFEGNQGTEYYISTMATAQKSGYYDISLEVDGKKTHTTLYITDQSEDKGRLTITTGPITLETGKKYVVKASYIDENGNLADTPGGITWSTLSGKNNGGEVDIKIISDYYEYCLCEVIGKKAGTCGVFASTQSGLSAPVTFYVVDPAPVQKETVEFAQPTGHLSGSKNYELVQTEEGNIDLNAPITSKITIGLHSKYSSISDIVIKNKGELVVDGKLGAQRITIKAGGKLTISSTGQVNVENITAEGGGWLSWNKGGMISSAGVLKAHTISIKGDGLLSMASCAQLIAYDGFSYNGHETDSLEGTLFIGGAMDTGKSFKASDIGFATVFFNDTTSSDFSFHEKSRLGTVFVANSERYDAIGLSPNNIVAAMKYLRVQQNDNGTWEYTPSNVKLETNWETEVGAWYRNLASARQTVITLSSYPNLSPADCDFISRLADVWVTSVSGQVLNSGFSEFSSSTYDLIFKLHNKEYKIRYSPFIAGAYANYGSVTFGEKDTDDEEMSLMGMTAAASTVNFWSQATAYLGESCVKEYYMFVKGSLPKGKSEASLKGFLEKKGKEFAKKYMEKVIDKYLFGTMKETGKSAEVKQIEKSFKVSKLVLNGDIEGLWKFAAEEIKDNILNGKSIKSVSDCQVVQADREAAKAQNSPAKASVVEAETGEADSEKETYAENDLKGTESLWGIDDSDEILDEYLKEALIEILGMDAEGNPDFSKQEGITFLDLSGHYIQSVQGLQRFTNLKTLILENNEIEDLEPLRGMTGLQYLDVSGQNIADISALLGLENLLYLDISDNDIATISSVGNMKQLKELDISDTQISTLAPLETVGELQILRASSIPMAQENLQSLENAHKLKVLQIDGCGLQRLEGLNTVNLEELYAGNNLIQSIEALCTAGKLKKAVLSDNMIENVPSLRSCNVLTSLDLSGNLLMEINGLAEALALKELNLSGCWLVDSELTAFSGLSTLENIDLSFNAIEDISPLFEIGTLKSVVLTGTDADLGDYTDLPLNIEFKYASIIGSGTCGRNARWIVTDKGRLTIYGKGVMEDYGSDTAPWEEYPVSDIRIGNGITRIGNYAFSGMIGLHTMYIPENVLEIGEEAFSYCGNLYECIVLDTVRHIGNNAFLNCAEGFVLYGYPDTEAHRYAEAFDIRFVPNGSMDDSNKYSVTIDANGGFIHSEIDDASGTEAANADTIIKKIQKDGNVFIVSGHVQNEDDSLFLFGWALSPNGEPVIDFNESYQPDGDCTLYAIWKRGKLAGTRLYGDLNNNGAIDSGDMLRVNRHIQANNDGSVRTNHPDWTLKGYDYEAADINHDSVIDSSDVDLITQSISAQNSEDVQAEHPDWILVETFDFYSFDEIEPISIAEATITGISSKIYTGNAITQAFAVKICDTILEKDTDYTVAYSNNINVGTATMTITGKGNYTGTVSKNFKITGISIAKATVTGISNKTYTGKVLTQTPKVTLGSITLTHNTDYIVSYKNNTNAGTATLTITGKGNYTGTKSATFKINKASQSITAKSSAASVAVGNTVVVSITGAKGTKSYKSSNINIATVDAKTGKVTAKKVGTVKITAVSAATSNYNAASKAVTIKVVPAATSSITATNQPTGIKLTWKKVTGANGYLVFRGSTKIATISKGTMVTYTDKKANTNGTKYTYKIIAKATTGNSTLSKSLTTYRVARPAISSVKNSASKKMTVKWGKNTKANGYQIQYSTSKAFASGNKTASVTSVATVSKVIGSLTKGKTYYVRIRTYKTVGKTKYWSIWSALKSVIISK